MAKKRTRKQKEKVKYDFLIDWNPDNAKFKNEAKMSDSEAVVKGQFAKSQKTKKRSSPKPKKAITTAKEGYLASIKRDLVKSLILAGVIIASEIMLYLLLPKS
jgi:hypothetical protein